MKTQPGADSRQIKSRQRISASIDCTPRKAGRPSRDIDAAEWWPKYVAAYRETGSVYLAAERAGVSVPTARRYRRSHAEAQRDLLTARAYFRDSLQYLILQIARGEVRGNVIAALARAKASGKKLAELYSEKAVDARVLNITQNNFGPSAEYAATLDALMRDLTPDRLLALRGEAAPAQDVGIVDAEIVGPPEEDTP